MNACPECGGGLVATTYQPMAKEYWRCYQCPSCRWEEHVVESRTQAAARLMAVGEARRHGIYQRP